MISFHDSSFIVVFQCILNKEFIYFKFSLINEEIFRVYTKTFGGKIWTSLYRVFPDNFFAKIFNKASFKIPAKKIIKQHLVQKN